MRSSGAFLSGMLLVLVGVCAQAAPAPQPTLLVVGDSLSAAYKIPVEKGWVHLLAERLRRRGYDYRVVNASITGDTTAGGLARLADVLERCRPAIVIVELGGNDGLQGLPLDQMRRNLLAVIRRIEAAGAEALLVGVRLPPNYGEVYARRFAAVYRQVAEQTGTPLVARLLAGVATHPELMQERGIHPRAVAQPILLDNVWPALEPLLVKPPSGAGIRPPPALSSARPAKG